MPHESRIVAGIEVIPLCDAVGPMGEMLRRPLGETFPNAGPDAWVRSGTRPDDPWVLHFHCYLLRTDDRTILVDTGLGGADSPASSWAPVPGRLTAELTAVGMTPEDVDTVVLTHLHSDHASGCVTGMKPTFPNARHLVQQAELDGLTGPMAEEVVVPLAGLLDPGRGSSTLAPGISIISTPGHTPGHQSVLIGAGTRGGRKQRNGKQGAGKQGDEELLITGDLVLHAVQLADPSVTYLYDDDPDAAAATRTAVLERLPRAILATAHLPEPFSIR